jgi:hypothetical protein
MKWRSRKRKGSRRKGRIRYVLVVATVVGEGGAGGGEAEREKVVGGREGEECYW